MGLRRWRRQKVVHLALTPLESRAGDPHLFEQWWPGCCRGRQILL